ncbi:MAG: energy-coupling factor transporter transmembrane component T [Thermoprotei archaeon]
MKVLFEFYFLLAAASFVVGELLLLYILFDVIGMSGLEELSRYEKGTTFYYILNPVTKMLVQIACTVVVYIAAPSLTIALTVVLLGSFLTLRNGREKYRLAFWLTVMTALAGFWSFLAPFNHSYGLQLSAQPAAVLQQLAGFASSAVYQASKTMLVLLASLIIVVTTTPSQVLRVLERLKIPVFITFSLVVAMRELPRLFRSIDTFMKVQFLRGFGSNAPRVFRPFYYLAAFLFSVIPVMVFVLRGAKTTAVAADTRAFRAYNHRTNIYEIRFTKLDALVLAAVLAGLLALWLY